MKRFRFLLLDAGPILKLFEVGAWDSFIEKCDVTICRTVAEEARWASRDLEDVPIELEGYDRGGLIQIVDVQPSVVKAFYDGVGPSQTAAVHAGEAETLAFLCDSQEEWLVCSADKAVFRMLGALQKAGQGISLEEVLTQVGLARQLEWKCTKQFRQKYTALGQADFVQDF